MLTIKTNKPFNILDINYNVIDSKDIYLTIENIYMDRNGVTAKGYYYYKKIETTEEAEVETVIKLRNITTPMSWDIVTYVEGNQLPPISSSQLLSSVLERVMQFTIIQLTIEDGQNFGTHIEDWDFTPL
jgi:hypothetical protein